MLFVPESTLLHCIHTSTSTCIQLRAGRLQLISTTVQRPKGENTGAFVGGALTSQGDFPRKSCNQDTHWQQLLAQKSRDSRHQNMTPSLKTQILQIRKDCLYCGEPVAERLVLPRNIKKDTPNPSLPAWRGWCSASCYSPWGPKCCLSAFSVAPTWSWPH